MSSRASGAVWNSGLYTGAALLVALKLGDYADDDGWSWPSVGQISRMTATVPRQVRRVTGDMAGEAVLFKEVPRGRGRLNRYKLNVPLLELTGRVWRLMQDADAVSTRFDSLAAMTASAAFRNTLGGEMRQAFFAEKEALMSPIRSRKGDMKSAFTPLKGDMESGFAFEKGTSGAQKADSGVLQNPSGNPVRRARVREGADPGRGAVVLDMDGWATLRRAIRQRVGDSVYTRDVAMIRLEHGALTAPTEQAAQALAYCAREALVRAGVTWIAIEGGGGLEL